MRVVSLVPSSTETVLALGGQVVGCTRFCEQPGIPIVGGTKNPDLEAIAALTPDLVVVDREENRREDAGQLEVAGFAVFVTDVRSVEDAADAVFALADRLGLEPPDMTLPEPVPVQRSVFVPIWRRPWMSINADTYGASVLARLGCRLVTADADTLYPVVDMAAVAASRPDVVLVPSEPYDFSAQHVDELLGELGDVAMEHIDGQDLFWWGVRTPAAIERLRAALDHVPGASADGRTSTNPDVGSSGSDEERSDLPAEPPDGSDEPGAR